MGVYTEPIQPSYAYQGGPNIFATPPAQPLQQPQQFYEPQFNWDDVNLNNIVGEMPPQNRELTNLDWVCACRQIECVVANQC